MRRLAETSCEILNHQADVIQLLSTRDPTPIVQRNLGRDDVIAQSLGGEKMEVTFCQPLNRSQYELLPTKEKCLIPLLWKEDRHNRTWYLDRRDYQIQLDPKKARETNCYNTHCLQLEGISWMYDSKRGELTVLKDISKEDDKPDEVWSFLNQDVIIKEEKFHDMFTAELQEEIIEENEKVAEVHSEVTKGQQTEFSPTTLSQNATGSTIDYLLGRLSYLAIVWKIWLTLTFLGLTTSCIRHSSDTSRILLRETEA